MLLLVGDFSTQNVPCNVNSCISNKVIFVILVAVAVNMAYIADGSIDFNSINLEYHIRNGNCPSVFGFPRKLNSVQTKIMKIVAYMYVKNSSLEPIGQLNRLIISSKGHGRHH